MSLKQPLYRARRDTVRLRCSWSTSRYVEPYRAPAPAPQNHLCERMTKAVTVCCLYRPRSMLKCESRLFSQDDMMILFFFVVGFMFLPGWIVYIWHPSKRRSAFLISKRRRDETHYPDTRGTHMDIYRTVSGPSMFLQTSVLKDVYCYGPE